MRVTITDTSVELIQGLKDYCKSCKKYKDCGFAYRTTKDIIESALSKFDALSLDCIED